MSLIAFHSSETRSPRLSGHRAKIVLSCSVLCLWFSGASLASPLSGLRIDFDSPPAWTVSGAWGRDESLILVDALHSKVFRYTKDGTKLETLSGPSGGALAFPRPSTIYPLKSGYLLEDEEAHLVRLGDNYRPLAAFNLLPLAKNAKGEVGSVFNWAPLDDDEVVTFSDIRQGDHWYSAFLRIPLSNPAGFEVLQRVESEEAKRFYLFGNPYVAAVDGEAFFLVMDEQPYLARGGSAGKSPGRMAALSALGARRPPLPEQRGAGSARALYEVLERSVLPMGLYGWKGHLYLVMRQKIQGREGLGWALVKVDPVQDRIISSRPLDSTANHLTVIPGPHFWAFIEKGPVQGLGQQEVRGLLLIPAAEIERK